MTLIGRQKHYLTPTLPLENTSRHICIKAYFFIDFSHSKVYWNDSNLQFTVNLNVLSCSLMLYTFRRVMFIMLHTFFLSVMQNCVHNCCHVVDSSSEFPWQLGDVKILFAITCSYILQFAQAFTPLINFYKVVCQCQTFKNFKTAAVSGLALLNCSSSPFPGLIIIFLRPSAVSLWCTTWLVP